MQALLCPARSVQQPVLRGASGEPHCGAPALACCAQVPHFARWRGEGGKGSDRCGKTQSLKSQENCCRNCFIPEL